MRFLITKKQLENIDLGNIECALGEKCFESCEAIKNVKISKNIYNIKGHCFDKCYVLETIDLSGIKKISDICSFKHCRELKDIGEFNEALMELPAKTFINCSNLKVSNLKNIKKLGNDCFKDCIMLSQDIVRDVEEIGENCFSHCNFTELYLKKAKKIENNAFGGMYSLAKIRFGNNQIPILGANIVNGSNVNEWIYPKEYITQPGYSDFLDKLKVSKVIWNYNYGNFNSQVTQDLKLNSLKPPKPKFERFGYQIEGWYKEPECINKVNILADLGEVIDSDLVIKNPELYAKWRETQESKPSEPEKPKPEEETTKPSESEKPKPEEEQTKPSGPEKPKPEEEQTKPSEPEKPKPEEEQTKPSGPEKPKPEEEQTKPSEPGKPKPEEEQTKPSEPEKPKPEEEQTKPSEPGKPKPEEEQTKPSEPEKQKPEEEQTKPSEPEKQKPEEEQTKPSEPGKQKPEEEQTKPSEPEKPKPEEETTKPSEPEKPKPEEETTKPSEPEKPKTEEETTKPSEPEKPKPEEEQTKPSEPEKQKPEEEQTKPSEPEKQKPEEEQTKPSEPEKPKPEEETTKPSEPEKPKPEEEQTKPSEPHKLTPTEPQRPEIEDRVTKPKKKSKLKKRINLNKNNTKIIEDENNEFSRKLSNMSNVKNYIKDFNIIFNNENKDIKLEKTRRSSLDYEMVKNFILPVIRNSNIELEVLVWSYTDNINNNMQITKSGVLSKIIENNNCIGIYLKNNDCFEKDSILKIKLKDNLNLSKLYSYNEELGKFILINDNLKVDNNIIEIKTTNKKQYLITKFDLNKDDIAAYGWNKIERDWYYLQSNGVLAVNTVIDGYSVGSDGKLI